MSKLKLSKKQFIYMILMGFLAQNVCLAGVEDNLANLGLTLPEVSPPIANFVHVNVVDSFIYVSGQLPIDGATKYIGKLGDGSISIDDAIKAAELCALNIIAKVKTVAPLDNVRCIKITGLVNSTSDFIDHPKIINGASDLLVNAFKDIVLGDINGQHAREAFGVASLPLGVAVEISAIFKIIE
jgi:enamine deaminase RidA (YjgF/YER057c/UK114 family)